MSKNIRVAVFEDNDATIDRIRENLEAGGHRLVVTAKRLKDALDVIRKLPELGVGVVTVDGNLEHGEKAGESGRQIIAAIGQINRRLGMNILTIGLSRASMVGVDYDLGKENLFRLSETIDSLMCEKKAN